VRKLERGSYEDWCRAWSPTNGRKAGRRRTSRATCVSTGEEAAMNAIKSLVARLRAALKPRR
jgi:hypothetical protein